MNGTLSTHAANITFFAWLVLGMVCSTASASETVGGTAVHDGQTAPTTAAETASAIKLPASFEGELPCADCPGIFYRLDLFEDHTFFLRTTYLGRGAGAVTDSVGSWELSADDRKLTLFTGEKSPVWFRVVDPDTLRKLDIEGHEIRSSLNYDLRRKDGLEPIEPRLTMRGMYRYMADAALFEECLSGRTFPVAQEADNAALERAYLEARRQPGEPILVSLQGRIARRPGMEGDGMVLAVVPERLLGVWPGETCGARGSVSEILGTYWKLTRLGEQPVSVGGDQREPHLVLHSEDGRVSGFGGCNQLMGSYAIEGSSIRFSKMASTMMACAKGADTEQALLTALEKAVSFATTAHHLELFDGGGEILARFEAREME